MNSTSFSTFRISQSKEFIFCYPKPGIGLRSVNSVFCSAEPHRPPCCRPGCALLSPPPPKGPFPGLGPLLPPFPRPHYQARNSQSIPYRAFRRGLRRLPSYTASPASARLRALCHNDGSPRLRGPQTRQARCSCRQLVGSDEHSLPAVYFRDSRKQRIKPRRSQVLDVYLPVFLTLTGT